MTINTIRLSAIDLYVEYPHQCYGHRCRATTYILRHHHAVGVQLLNAIFRTGIGGTLQLLTFTLSCIAVKVDRQQHPFSYNANLIINQTFDFYKSFLTFL